MHLNGSSSRIEHLGFGSFVYRPQTSLPHVAIFIKGLCVEAFCRIRRAAITILYYTLVMNAISKIATIQRAVVVFAVIRISRRIGVFVNNVFLIIYIYIFITYCLNIFDSLNIRSKSNSNSFIVLMLS